MNRILSTSLLLLPALLAGPAFAQDHDPSADLLKQAVELSMKSSQLAAQGKEKEAQALAKKAAALLETYAAHAEAKARDDADRALAAAKAKQAKAAEHAKQADFTRRAAEEAHAKHAEHADRVQLLKQVELQKLHERKKDAHLQKAIEFEALEEIITDAEGRYQLQLERLHHDGEDDGVHQFFAPGARLERRGECEDGTEEHEFMLRWIDENQLEALDRAQVWLEQDGADLLGRVRVELDDRTAQLELAREDLVLELQALREQLHPLAEGELELLGDLGECSEGDLWAVPELRVEFDDLTEDLDGFGQLPLIGELFEGEAPRVQFHVTDEDGAVLFPAPDAPEAPFEWGHDADGGGQQVQIFIAPRIQVQGQDGRFELRAHAAPMVVPGSHGANGPFEVDTLLAPDVEKKVVIVRPGDTLAGISKRSLGDADYWVELAEENELTHGQLHVGQELVLPAPAAPHAHGPFHKKDRAAQADQARQMIDAMRAELEALRAELRELRASVKSEERFR